MTSDGTPTLSGSPSPSPAWQPTKQIPTRVIGGYEIIEKIGQGGMGSVFKARQVSLDRIIALKVLPPSIAQDETFIKRFVREARACAKLSHPNIVLGIDVGQDQATKLWYFAMEFVDGPPLSRVLERRKVIPEQEALKLACDVAKALECAQQNGFVHRDVKPDNILLSSAGHAKLADLGLARHTKEEIALTQSGTAVGTPFYISPEQIRGEMDRLDIRTDLYALGGTLFHLVTGQPPFDGETSPVIMAKHLGETPPLAHRVNPEVSEATSRMIHRLMQKEKDKRFQTPRELIEHIEKILAGTLTASHRPRTTGPRDAVRTTGPRSPARGREPVAAGPAAPQKSAALYIGIGTAGVVALGAVLFFALGGKVTQEAEEEPAPDKLPSTSSAKSDSKTTPSATADGQLRAKFSALLAAAQEFEKNNPKDFKAAKAKYDQLISQAQGTPVASSFVPNAQDAGARIQQRWQEAADVAWQTREQKIAPLLEAADYDGALKLCEESQPDLDELLRPKATERIAAIRKAAEEKIAPAIEAAEAASTGAEPQKGLDALAKVEGIKFAPLNAKAEELKKRLQDEIANAAELEKKRIRLAAEKRLNEHLARFDAALLEKGDLAAARDAASAARDDASLKPLCEEQAQALAGIVKAFEDLQKQEAEALNLLAGTELNIGRDKGVVKKVEGDLITLTFSLEGPGGKATAQKAIRVSDLTAEQRAVIFRDVKLPETPDGKVAGALCKLRPGSADPTAAEELLTTAPDHPLTPHYTELARLKRLGATEDAAVTTQRGPDEKPATALVTPSKPAGIEKPIATAPRQATPSAEAVTDAERRLKEQLRDDYKKKGAADRIALATTLLKLAADTKEDAPTRFVMLREARDLAAAAGDCQTAFAAVDALAAVFAVDANDLKAAAFTATARAAASPEAAAKAVDAGQDLLEQLTGDGQYDVALKLIAPFEDLTRRANDAEAAKAVQTRAKELRAQQADWTRIKPHFEKLKEDPENAEAALTVGKYYVVSKGDWERALPLLAKSPAPDYKEAALKDLARPQETETRAALGDLWFALAEKEMGVLRTALQVRARFHYEDALPGLTGSAKAKAEKRLESLAGTTSAAGLNLLAAVDPAKDAVAGVWKPDGRGVVSDAGNCSRLMLPYEVPEEYDYRVEFTRNTGASTVALMLTKNGRPFVLETGWPAGQTGFAFVDGKHIDANPTTGKCLIVNGRRYTFLIQVRNTGLKAFVDGKQIISWKTDYKNVTPHTGWAFPNKQCVGFGSYLSLTTFHSAELIEVTGHGKRLR